MAEILSKSAYAKRHGKGPSAVSNWITRGQLTAPALRRDGKIDADLADQQLGLINASPSRQPVPTVSTSSGPAFTPVQQAQARFVAAKALDMAVKAERNRRELNAERGRYVLTADIRAEFGRGIMEHLQSVEQSLPDLSERIENLGPRERLLELRRWWRQQCQNTADRNRIEAASFPPYMEDPV